MPQWTGLEARRFTDVQIDGTNGPDMIDGTTGEDQIFGGNGDDLAFGYGDGDQMQGGAGFDVLYGGKGNDNLFGGTQADNLYGGQKDDALYGDSGYDTAKGSDLASDRLDSGSGNDRLVQGDGNDVMTGGSGSDTFEFRWQDPMVALAAGTGRAFATITDFDTADDRLTFDAAGVGTDRLDANFVDGGAGSGAPGGAAATFFTGAAAASSGEAVMVLTDQAFASGIDAVAAAQGEATGDLILYYNSTVNTGSLLYVDGTDSAHSILRFSDINSVQDLIDANFTANDFVFV